MSNKFPLAITTAIAIILIISQASAVSANENFGLGAEVEIKVERATQQPAIIETRPNLVYMFISFIFGIVVTLLLAGFRARRVTATTGALHGGEKLG